MTVDLKHNIRAQAKELGFDATGFVAAHTDPNDAKALARFLADGRHGHMAWLENANGRRGVPKALMPDVRSIIVLGANYGPEKNPLEIHQRRSRGAISVYAQGRDYHDVLKKRCKRLGRWIFDNYGGGIKVFVDTAPVMEKPLAQRAGVGWQGKHTNLVSRAFGSWLFLAEVFTTLDIAPDKPEPDHCGGCDRCLKACPTDALAEPYRIDARECVSYLTIEHSGEIAPELMARMGNRIYGCDDCLAVCPWNKFAKQTDIDPFQPRSELTAPRLVELARLDDAGFREFFSGSPIKRTGRDRFVRNVLIAMGNSGDGELLATAQALREDSSALVGGAAKWAARRLKQAGDEKKPPPSSRVR